MSDHELMKKEVENNRHSAQRKKTCSLEYGFGKKRDNFMPSR